MTSIASIHDIIEYDLTDYKGLLERLEEISLEIEAVLDDFPAKSDKHVNDRYNLDRRSRDARNEEEQWLAIGTLLHRQQEHTVCLRDVGSEDEDGLDDAVDVSGERERPYGILSHTNTHYPLGDAPALGTPLQPTGADGLEDSDSQDWLGLGFGLGEEEAAARILEPIRTPPPPPTVPQVSEPGVSPPSKAETPQDQNGLLREDTPRTVATATPMTRITEMVGPTTLTEGTQPITSSRTRAVSFSQAPPLEVIISIVTTASKPTIVVSIPGPILHRSSPQLGASTTTVTTTLTRTTPTMSDTSIRFSSPTLTPSNSRRRSSSEGQGLRPAGGRIETKEDKLFWNKQLVMHRSQSLASDLQRVLARIQTTSGTSTRWAESEIRDCQARLNELEELETINWVSIADVEGRTAQKKEDG